MFEKEAEDNKPPYACCSFNTDCELWKDGFQKGAEFGYNKAKVEVEESYRESLCNSELNLASVTEQLEELEKANEWHYVKDGDLPKDEEYKWCVSPSGYPYVARYEELFVSWTNQENKEVCCPSAWKEIVLPEEEMENESHT